MEIQVNLIHLYKCPRMIKEDGLDKEVGHHVSCTRAELDMNTCRPERGPKLASEGSTMALKARVDVTKSPKQE